MTVVLGHLTIEITRQCNQSCIHCLRGESQNINISKKYIDALFNQNLIILNLVFSGGEPTLCKDLVVYVIDKIIQKCKSVLILYMATNGIIYSDEILMAFERYKEYAKKNLNPLLERFQIPDRLIAVVEFSDDQFHTKIGRRGHIFYLLFSGRAKDNYHELKESNLFAGGDLEYKLYELKMSKKENEIFFSNIFYLTATGFITNNGNTSFVNMDKQNLGSIEEITFEKLYQNEMKNKILKLK